MYEEDQAAVEDALATSTSTAFTDDIISTIVTLGTGGSTGGTIQLENITVPTDGQVTVAAGTDLAFLSGSDTIQTQVVLGTDIKVLVFQGTGGFSAQLNYGTTIGGGDDIADRVIIGSAGNDNFVIRDTVDTKIVLGTGNSTVVAGGGEDTIVAGLGNSTITGGTGNTIVQLTGDEDDYVVNVVGGNAIITGANGITTDISRINFVQLDAGQGLVFAESTVEAGVAALYQATFGRTADADGLQYWYDLAASGVSLTAIANGFVNSSEYRALSLTDDQFLTSLYTNTFGRAVDADGLAYWTAQLANGATRADLLAAFASVAAMNDAGTLDTEVTTIGSVTVIGTII